jgi:hypothetical protein
MVKGEQRLLGQNHQKLDGEERISPGLFVHQLHERLSDHRITVQRINDEVPDIARHEGREHNLLHPSCGIADHSKCP